MSAARTNAARFLRASEAWEAGDLRKAFRNFLAGAKAGDRGSQVNVALFYDEGIGINADKRKAFYWNRRAWTKGDPSAANNIGLMYREQGDSRRAIEWLERAVRAGEDDSRLQLAELYMAAGHRSKAVAHLKRLARSSSATIDGCERAGRWLTALGVVWRTRTV